MYYYAKQANSYVSGNGKSNGACKCHMPDVPNVDIDNLCKASKKHYQVDHNRQRDSNSGDYASPRNT